MEYLLSPHNFPPLQSHTSSHHPQDRQPIIHIPTSHIQQHHRLISLGQLDVVLSHRTIMATNETPSYRHMSFPTLSESIQRVCACDPSLKELKFTARCSENLLNFEPSEDFDEEESHNGLDRTSRQNNDILVSTFFGSRDWYCDLAVMLSELPHLRIIAFESLDPYKTYA